MSTTGISFTAPTAIPTGTLHTVGMGAHMVEAERAHVGDEQRPERWASNPKSGTGSWSCSVMTVVMSRKGRSISGGMSLVTRLVSSNWGSRLDRMRRARESSSSASTHGGFLVNTADDRAGQIRCLRRLSDIRDLGLLGDGEEHVDGW